MTDLCAQARAGKRDFSPTALADALLTAAGPLPPDQVNSALEPYRKSGCLASDAAQPGQSSLWLAGLRFTQQRALLWRQGATWQAAALPLLDDMPRILDQADRTGGREVIFATEKEGTGHFGSFGLLRLQDGAWQVLFHSPDVDHAGITLLDPDHVLVQGRNIGDAPLAWPYNYAIPSNYQWLWQRQGDGFAVTAQRLVPDPAYTVSVFFGALQRHDGVWLSKLATPAAVAAATDLKLDSPDVKVLPPTEMTVSAKPEFRYWAALPAKDQGPAPTVTKGTATVPVEKGPVPAVTLQLERSGEAWIVTGVAPKH